MTIAQTKAAVAATGLIATWDADAGEYRVTFRKEALPCADRREAVAYYTDDAEDAIDTAWAMRRHAAQHGIH